MAVFGTILRTPVRSSCGFGQNTAKYRNLYKFGHSLRPPEGFFRIFPPPRLLFGLSAAKSQTLAVWTVPPADPPLPSSPLAYFNVVFVRHGRFYRGIRPPREFLTWFLSATGVFNVVFCPPRAFLTWDSSSTSVFKVVFNLHWALARCCSGLRHVVVVASDPLL